MPVAFQKTSATTKGGSKKSHYKALPKEFRRRGFSYRMVARQARGAIYEQRWCGCAEPSVCYEIIRVKRREGFEINGRFIEPAEVYPPSESWGVDGWTVQDKETAFCKLRELVNAPQKKSANPVKKSPIQNTKRCSESIKLRGDVKGRRHG